MIVLRMLWDRQTVYMLHNVVRIVAIVLESDQVESDKSKL